MSVRGAKTLSRLFQATVRFKRHSSTMGGPIPMVFEKELAFEPDSPSEEHERIRDYHSKLVFKDGEFIVRIVSLRDWDLAHYLSRRWICWMRRGDSYTPAGYSANPILRLSERGKWKYSSYYSTIIVSFPPQPLLFLFFPVADTALDSCNGQTDREET